MTTINIFLLVFAMIGSLAALMGKALQRGQKFPKCITSVGWVSIVSLCAALAVGICKEVVTRALERETAAKTEAKEARYERTIADLQNLLSRTAVAVEKQGTAAEAQKAQDDSATAIVREVTKKIQDGYNPTSMDYAREGLLNGYTEVIKNMKIAKYSQDKIDAVVSFGEPRTISVFKSMF